MDVLLLKIYPEGFTHTFFPSGSCCWPPPLDQSAHTWVAPGDIKADALLHRGISRSIKANRTWAQVQKP